MRRSCALEQDEMADGSDSGSANGQTLQTKGSEQCGGMAGRDIWEINATDDDNKLNHQIKNYVNDW